MVPGMAAVSVGPSRRSRVGEAQRSAEDRLELHGARVGAVHRDAEGSEVEVMMGSSIVGVVRADAAADAADPTSAVPSAAHRRSRVVSSRGHKEEIVLDVLKLNTLIERARESGKSACRGSFI